MDVENKVRGLTNHIQNANVRERTAAFLRDTLAQLDAIKGMDDEHDSQEDYALKNDGTPVVSIESLEQKQQERLDVLSQLSFEDDGDDANTESVGDTSTVSAVKVEAEIDKRFRYGYTRLMEAVVDHDIQTVKNCLALGANRYICDNGGNNCEEKALKLGYDDIVEILRHYP